MNDPEYGFPTSSTSASEDDSGTFYPFYPASDASYDISDVPSELYDQRRKQLYSICHRLQKGQLLNRRLQDTWTLKVCKFCKKSLNSPHQSLMHLWSDAHVKRVYGHLGAVPEADYQKSLSFLARLLKIYSEEEASEALNPTPVVPTALPKTSSGWKSKLTPKKALPLCRVVNPYFCLRSKAAASELENISNEFTHLSEDERKKLNRICKELFAFSPNSCPFCEIAFNYMDDVIAHIFTKDHLQRILKERSCTAADLEFWRMKFKEASKVEEEKSTRIEKRAENSEILEEPVKKTTEPPTCRIALPFTALREEEVVEDEKASESDLQDLFEFLDAARQTKKIKRLLRWQNIPIDEKSCSFCGVNYQIPSVAVAHILTKKHVLRVLGAGHVATKAEIHNIKSLIQ